MKGIQEYVTYHEHRTKKIDLFCGKCYEVIKLNTTINKKTKYICSKCGMENVFTKEDNVRNFNARAYHVKRPIVYWARKYGIPENSCYMAFRRRGIGITKKSQGNPKLMTNREFLSAVVFTSHGQKLVSRMIRKEKLLTDKEITNII